mmetsp:Transcript_97601/g.271548  ORF Transcript_97601/g.271548 Transcript_97601/m.271548 type:complete len:236 (+) Transcript_97601:1255-1962(+)
MKDIARFTVPPPLAWGVILCAMYCGTWSQYACGNCLLRSRNSSASKTAMARSSAVLVSMTFTAATQISPELASSNPFHTTPKAPWPINFVRRNLRLPMASSVTFSSTLPPRTSHCSSVALPSSWRCAASAGSRHADLRDNDECRWRPSLPRQAFSGKCAMSNKRRDRGVSNSCGEGGSFKAILPWLEWADRLSCPPPDKQMRVGVAHLGVGAPVMLQSPSDKLKWAKAFSLQPER